MFLFIIYEAGWPHKLQTLRAPYPGSSSRCYPNLLLSEAEDECSHSEQSPC